MLVVGGGDLLDLNEVRVTRALIAQPGGVGFRRITLPGGDRAAPVRRPGADGLALAESDLIGRHSVTSLEVGLKAFCFVSLCSICARRFFFSFIRCSSRVGA